MNIHPSYLVYTHIGRFFESRNLVPSDAEALEKTQTGFVTELERIGFFRLTAEAADGRVTVVLLLNPVGKFANQGPKLRELVGSQHSEAIAERGRLHEVIVVAPESVLRKKNMLVVVRDYQAEAERLTGKQAAGRAKFYTFCPYYTLSIDVLRAQCTSHHAIAGDEEVRSFLARERLSLSDLKRIGAADPPVFWIGGRIGQIIKITLRSETAGEAYSYRLVSDL